MERFGIDELHVTVVADAAHKPSEAPAGDRLAMAALAFAELDAEVELEQHRYTVDALEAAGYDDPIFLIGADELVAFPTWKQPERVLELARLGVATRPGYAPTTASPRIRTFELEPHPVSSSEIRERVRSGEPIDGLVAPEVAAVHRRARPVPRRLTSGFPGYTEGSDFARTSTPDRRSREREAGRRRRHSRHEARVRLHGLLRARDRPQPPPDEGDLRRGARQLKQDAKLLPRAVDGAAEAEWIIADYLDVVLHVFTPETRAFYRLEDLWGDVPAVDVEAATA